MRGWMLTGAAVGLVAVAACSAGIGPTFDPGVELVPGPGHFLVKVVPAEARDTRRISFTGDDQRLVMFTGQKGDERFASGLNLPSTLRAHVDGQDCSGSIDLESDMEYDATLTIDGDRCELRLDVAHRVGTIDHALEDDDPMSSGPR